MNVLIGKDRVTLSDSGGWINMFDARRILYGPEDIGWVFVQGGWWQGIDEGKEGTGIFRFIRDKEGWIQIGCELFSPEDIASIKVVITNKRFLPTFWEATKKALFGWQK